MKVYMLLRDNQESGPYTLEAIRNMKLYPLDLIWIEGESASWQYPTEMEELKDLVVQRTRSSIPGAQGEHSHIYISLPGSNKKKAHRINPETQVRDDSSFAVTRTWEALKERHQELTENKEIWSKRVAMKHHPILNLLVIFAGLLVGATLLKKLVDQMGDPTENETYMAPVAYSASDKLAAPVNEISQHGSVATNTTFLSKKMPPSKEKAATIPQEKTIDLRKLIEVKRNDYKVGLLGGINNLELTVFNNSPQLIQSVVVAVDYLKPNGKVLSTNQYEIKSVRPYHSQTLLVPPTKRGVKVAYRIVSITPQRQKVTMKNV
jgi:hypothetical protein